MNVESQLKLMKMKLDTLKEHSMMLEGSIKTL